MKRVDVFKGYKISDIEEYKEYEIIDSYPNGDRTTYYIKPSLKNEDKAFDNPYAFSYSTYQEHSYRDLYTNKKISTLVEKIVLKNKKTMSKKEWFDALDKQMKDMNEVDIFNNLLDREKNQPWASGLTEEQIIKEAYISYSYRFWERKNIR